MPALTPENKVKVLVNAMLKQEGVWWFSVQNFGYGGGGIPDKLACVAGQLVGIEVKADAKKKPTPKQQAQMNGIEANGGKCFVVYDKETIEEVRQYIRERLK